MSIEAKIRITAIFPSEDSTKIAASVLKKSLNKNDHELAKDSLHESTPDVLARV